MASNTQQLLEVVERLGLKVRPHGRTFVRRCPRTKSTCTTYFYIVLVLLYDAKKFFVQTVVHSTLLVSCTKFSVRVTFL